MVCQRIDWKALRVKGSTLIEVVKKAEAQQKKVVHFMLLVLDDKGVLVNITSEPRQEGSVWCHHTKEYGVIQMDNTCWLFINWGGMPTHLQQFTLMIMWSL